MTAIGVNRQEAQQWCLAHAYELVELNPEELPDEDGESCELCSLYEFCQFVLFIYFVVKVAKMCLNMVTMFHL